MKQQQEYQLQKQVCDYVSTQYPNVLFLSDTIASVSLTMPQAMRNKAIQKNGFKCPDLLILEPRKGYSGLFIELKKDSPYKKDGTLKKNKHLEHQEKSMQKLRSKGYYCLFSWTFEQTQRIIDFYLK